MSDWPEAERFVRGSIDGLLSQEPPKRRKYYTLAAAEAVLRTLLNDREEPGRYTKLSDEEREAAIFAARDAVTEARAAERRGWK